jgi:hypothetical protein
MVNPTDLLPQDLLWQDIAERFHSAGLCNAGLDPAEVFHRVQLALQMGITMVIKPISWYKPYNYNIALSMYIYIQYIYIQYIYIYSIYIYIHL